MEWIQTDVYQWGRHKEGLVYEFKEQIKLPNGKTQLVSGEINLEDYTNLEIELCLEAYGYDLSLLKSDPFVTAECLFETNILDFID